MRRLLVYYVYASALPYVVLCRVVLQENRDVDPCIHLFRHRRVTCSGSIAGRVCPHSHGVKSKIFQVCTES
jgi:hypothetical protein